MPPVMGTSVLLWTTLMLFYISLQPDLSEATQESVVSLHPPWNRIFLGENVTLTCSGNDNLQSDSTRWFLNGTDLNVSNKSFHIVNAKDLDSGEYRCQNKNFNQSKPVRLHVFSGLGFRPSMEEFSMAEIRETLGVQTYSQEEREFINIEDWLLLQATAEEVIEGEALFIRCHGWKNRKVKKVTYYKDGIALKYWYENHNLSIISTTIENSGIYSCVGSIWQIQRNSSSLKIIVKEGPYKIIYLLKLLIPLLVVILFAVDTVLFIFTQQEFKFLLTIKSTRKGGRPMSPRRKSDPKKI